MVADRQVLLHLIELAGLDDGEWIFLTVDHLLLKRRIELRKTHRHRIDTQRGKRVDVDRRLNHPQLDSLEIAQLGDWALAIGDIAKPELPIGQVIKAFGGQQIGELLAEASIQNLVGFRTAIEHEGKIEDGEFLLNPLQNAGIHRGKVNRPALHR